MRIQGRDTKSLLKSKIRDTKSILLLSLRSHCPLLLKSKILTSYYPKFEYVKQRRDTCKNQST